MLAKDKVKVGGKYTLYKVSEVMAWTVAWRITVREVNDKGIVYAHKGKRKRYIQRDTELEPFTGLLFEGWEQPFRADCETSSFCGNACVNIIGGKLAIAEWVDTKNINPNVIKWRIIACSADNASQRTEAVVYPELYEVGTSAPIDRIIISKEAKSITA